MHWPIAMALKTVGPRDTDWVLVAAFSALFGVLGFAYGSGRSGLSHEGMAALDLQRLWPRSGASPLG